MLIWIDLETTGLDPERDRVLEVACVVTDDEFAEVARDRWVLKIPEDRPLGEWEPVVQQMHAKNKLIVECWEDKERQCASNVDYKLRDFLVQRGAIGAVLAGSTVSFDRAFMRRHLPTSFGLLHYRNLDVTSINEIARRTWPEIYEARPGQDTCAKHRALDDVLASIEVARYYRRALHDTCERERAAAAESAVGRLLTQLDGRDKEIATLRGRIAELYQTSNA